jgi:hypothetical protein
MNYQYTITGIKDQNDLNEFQNLLEKIPYIGVIKSITTENVVFSMTRAIDTKTLNLNFVDTPYVLSGGQTLDNIFDDELPDERGYDCE